MRWMMLALLGPLCLSILLVVGQTDSDTDNSSTSTHSTTQDSSTISSTTPHSRQPKSTSTTRGGIAPFKTKTTHSHRPPPTTAVTGTDPFPFPDPLSPPASTHPPHPEDHPDNHSGPSGWTIFLEVIGTLLGLALVAALFRCFWSYRRTPRHRHARIESILEIRRELLENNRPRSEVYSQPPPPPYRNPPSYEVSQTPHTGPTLVSSALSPSPSLQEPQQPQQPPPPPLPATAETLTS